MEETLERRRMEASSLQQEVMQKVPELVVHERMFKKKRVMCQKEKKKVKGWSNEAEVLDKNKIYDSEREAFRGRGAPLEWPMVGY